MGMKSWVFLVNLFTKHVVKETNLRTTAFAKERPGRLYLYMHIYINSCGSY